MAGGGEVRRRLRQYEVYATGRGGAITNQSRAFPRPCSWRYFVKAVSIKQAYYLAAHEVFAPDAKSAGVCVMETDYWHRNMDSTQAEAEGLRVVAPFILAGLGQDPS